MAACSFSTWKPGSRQTSRNHHSYEVRSSVMTLASWRVRAAIFQNYPKAYSCQEQDRPGLVSGRGLVGSEGLEPPTSCL
jgi:hypothetical protein